MKLDFDERDRRSVVGDLASDDEEVRRLAVERVGALPLADAVPLLVACLGDPSWRVRKAAVERLVASPEGSGALEELIAALADGANPGRRNAAVEALVRAGARAIPRLLEALRADDVDVRKFSVDALAGIGDPCALAGLVERLGDRDVNVRAAAADALGAIAGAEAERALVGLAASPGEDRLVRFSALRALESLGVRLPALELLAVLDDPVLRPAGLALLDVQDADPTLEILIKALQAGSRATREAAMRAVLRGIAAADAAGAERIGARLREAVGPGEALLADALERLDGADLATRLLLVQFLGLLRVGAGVVPILRAAGDEALAEVALATLATLGEGAELEIDAAWEELDADARRHACLLFGRTGGPRSAARLLACLADPSPELRTAAACSIGSRGLAEGVPELVRRLEAAALLDDRESEEEASALAAALIGLAGPGAAAELTERTVALLRSRLQGAEEGVRLALARVLGRIGRPEDAELVALLLKDPAAGVRRAAVDALARLDPGTASEPLRLALGDESALVRMAAAAALGASASDQVEADLRRLARDDDPLVRAAALRALGSRFGRHAEAARRAVILDLLPAALRDAPPVALTALETLREAGIREGGRVVEVLARSEPELLQEAARCLGAIGEAPELDALVPLVGHPDWPVRAEAIQVLAERGRVGALPAILRRLETEQDEFVREVILAALRRLEA